jgi:pyrroline-5-carboxylate reductase
MQQHSPVRIAFLGGGNMARALIAGLIKQAIPGHHISVGEPDGQTRMSLRRDWGVQVSEQNIEAVRGANLVVLAVKPQHAAGVLQGLQAALRESSPVLLSIAAGLRIADLDRACAADIAIVRAMPNRPALVGAGITGLYAPPRVTAAQRQLAELVGKASGHAVWLHSESQLDIVTALSGSGPAYFFLLAELMARAAEQLGLERSTAVMLASATLYGSGMLAKEATDLAQQRAAVTSKGGTTEAALRILDQGGLEKLIAEAMRTSTARSAELASLLGDNLQAERHPGER